MVDIKDRIFTISFSNCFMLDMKKNLVFVCILKTGSHYVALVDLTLM